MIGVQGGRSARPSAKKARHNKVYTARGLRDRRVRLSADTAIQFYDVQDRLGYERATEAVDWLLQKAKTSIDKLFDTSSQQLQNMTNPVSQISAQQGGCHSESMLARAELEQTNPHNSLDGSLELPYVGNSSSSYNTLEFSATPYFQKILETNQNQKTNMFNCESSSSGEHFIWNVNSAPFFLQSSTPGHNDDSSRSSKLPLFQL